MKRYKYVGPPEILRSIATLPTRRLITGAPDVAAWARATSQYLDRIGEVTATFIIDTDARLWIADRRSEHVACAASLQVLAAGEMTFRIVLELLILARSARFILGFKILVDAEIRFA